MSEGTTPNSPDRRRYAGRFAPSPTGPLHAGSLVAALASYLDAKGHRGSWLLRIDDIDPPRQQAGATESIIECLRAHGLVPDEVDYQSLHKATYEQALTSLAQRGLLFLCQCTRATLGLNGICIRDCAQRSITQETIVQARQGSLRVSISPSVEVAFSDLIYDKQHAALGQTHANFIVKRRDGLYAYQLAAACDDGNGEITHAIRGADLLDSTFKQIYLQQVLDLTTPNYGHLPLVYGADGSKLSKQTGAQALDNRHPQANLMQAARVLGLPPAPKTALGVSGLLAWFTAQWRYDRVTR